MTVHPLQSLYDVCYCGDYRHQHNARGCLICHGSSAPYDNCSGSRLVERANKQAAVDDTGEQVRKREAL